MKKIISFALIVLLVLSLMAACGGNNESAPPANNVESAAPEENAGTAPAPVSEIIKPSQLISRADAEILVGQSMSDYKIDTVEEEGPGSMRTIYISDEYMFQIAIMQDALLDENDDMDKLYIDQGGVRAFINNLRDSRVKNLFELETIPVEGIGDGGFLVDQNGLGFWAIELFKGDYFVNITITYDPPTTHTRGEAEESAWRKEMLFEAGKLAIERLEAILAA